jgi:hypothetical protein
MASKPQLVSAFSPEYLEAVEERDDPSTSQEADTAEPWEVREAAGRHGLFHPWERWEHGDVPRALFDFEETAWLFRLVWPALGRERIFRLGGTPAVEGYPVETLDQTVGHLREFNPEAIFAAHLASYFVRTPRALALLLWLAGPTAQATVGEILAELATSQGKQPASRPGKQPASGPGAPAVPNES